MRMHHIDLNQMYIGGDWEGAGLALPNRSTAPLKLFHTFLRNI